MAQMQSRCSPEALYDSICQQRIPLIAFKSVSKLHLTADWRTPQEDQISWQKPEPYANRDSDSITSHGRLPSSLLGKPAAESTASVTVGSTQAAQSQASEPTTAAHKGVFLAIKHQMLSQMSWPKSLSCICMTEHTYTTEKAFGSNACPDGRLVAMLD